MTRPLSPLTGVTVLALEQAVAAPFATRQLADLGARVIKVERPDGGDFARRYDTTVRGLSSHFVWLNRSKESISLDVKSPAGRELFDRLLAQADVFVCNLSARAVDDLELSPRHVRERFPKLIACQLSGYGSTGSYRDRKAYDLLIQAESGLLSISGTEAAPARVGISIADISGGMYAFSGIMAALYQREKTGDGASLDLSLLECVGEWMGYPAYFTGYGGTQPARTGTRHAVIAPYGDFGTSDGGSIYLGVQNEREWVRFCEDVLVRPEIASDARFSTNRDRVEHREELFVLIETVFRGATAAELLDRLASADIAHAEMNDVVDFVGHPQLRERDRWCDVDSPAGTIWALKPPINMEGFEPAMGRVPELGEHSSAIASEVGLSGEQIEELVAAGVLVTA